MIITTNKLARKILANNLVYFRLNNGWSQEDFADKLETTTAYLSTLENAKRNTSIDYIEHLATTLNVPLEELFIKRPKVENHRIPRTR